MCWNGTAAAAGEGRDDRPRGVALCVMMGFCTLLLPAMRSSLCLAEARTALSAVSREKRTVRLLLLAHDVLLALPAVHWGRDW